MSARINDLIDAIVAAINAETWSIAVTAERKIRPRYKLAELQSGIKVAVVPSARTSEAKTRQGGPNLYTYEIDLGFFDALPGNESERDDLVEARIDLVDAISEWWIKRSITLDGVKAMTIASAVVPLFDAEYLENGVFASVLTLTLEETR